MAGPRPRRGSRAVHRQRACDEATRELGARAALVREGHPHRLQAGDRGAPRAPGPAQDGDVMGKVTGFLETARAAPHRRPIAERLRDWREVEHVGSDAKEQAGRCMDCGVPFCTQGCPLGNPIPDFAHGAWTATREGWLQAYRALAATNDFPEFTGRICPAPCEGACVLNIDNAPVTIEALERAVAERACAEGWVVPRRGRPGPSRRRRRACRCGAREAAARPRARRTRARRPRARALRSSPVR